MANTEGKGIWARLGSGITTLRNVVLNTLFLVFLAIFVIALFADDTPDVPEDSALLVNPRGILVDQRSVADPLARFLSPDAPGEVVLGELTKAIERAQTDERIRLIVLDLDELAGLSGGQAVIIGNAIQNFQAAGKEVVAYGTSFSQSQYLLASYADAVYLHPMGQLLLTGYGSNQLYFKELLDTIQVNLHIFRAGKYKEFVEPYTRTDMSPEAREANQSLVDELWTFYGEKVIENRDLTPATFQTFTHDLPALLEQMRDLPTVAVEHHLVDELLTYDAARERIADEVGYAADGDFKRIGFEDYLAATNGQPEASLSPSVGVISAEGPIVMGRQSQGAIAADTVRSLIRKARRNDDIRALVLQVNSPGGSAFASEMIRQELELLQLAGKPVVVSMSNVAASGGYWIAATADRILARPTTITGSIGVFGLIPTFEDSLAEIGVTSDGVGTTPLSRAFDPFSGLSSEMATILQLNVARTYEQFLNLVARGREMTPEGVEEVAQGRVWTGNRALNLGLVDEIGGLEDAIDLAAELADIGDEFGIERLRPSVSPRDLILSSLTEIRTDLVSHPIWQELSDAEALIRSLNDPANSYAICEMCLSPGSLLD
jgi:protease-4